MQSNVLASSSEDELPRHANVRADHDAARAENETLQRYRNGQDLLQRMHQST